MPSNVLFFFDTPNLCEGRSTVCEIVSGCQSVELIRFFAT
jgi:hypothetical protein